MIDLFINKEIHMQVGVHVVDVVTLYRVIKEVACFGGPAEKALFFENKDEAELAKTVYSDQEAPTEVKAYKLSDGTYIQEPQKIELAAPPSKKEIKQCIHRLHVEAPNLLEQFLK